MAHAIFDEKNWSVDLADPSVGIFGDTFIHESCKKVYDQGCTLESTLIELPDTKTTGYAKEKFTVTCLDCGKSTKFTDRTFVGFDCP